MNVTIGKSDFGGTVKVTSSKSHLHRALICASLADRPSKLYYNGRCDDVEATINCLNALGAEITDKGDYYSIIPVKTAVNALLDCNESGSTLRFMLPIVCALGVECTLTGSKKLLSRPIEPLVNELKKHGASIEKNDDRIVVSGGLKAGKYSVRGDISSQFITGLLLALPLLDKASELEITGNIQSGPYIDMTVHTLSRFGVDVQLDERNTFAISPSGRYRASAELKAEGDWSNGAFWLILGGMTERGITVEGLETDSPQGDKVIVDIMRKVGADVAIENGNITVKRGQLLPFEYDCRDTPDLVPAISILAAVCDGDSMIHNVARLRLKESDRIETTMAMLTSVGAVSECVHDTLYIRGGHSLKGGTVDSFNDHRIAMAAAVARAMCENDVAVLGANAVNKSYRSFWKTFEAIGGIVNKWEG